MKKQTLLVFLCTVSAMGSAGCSMCSDGSKIPESEPVEGTKGLPWEDLQLGVAPDVFRSGLAGIAGLKDGADSEAIGCVDQSTMEVIDPEAGVVSERKGEGRSLSNCALMQAGKGRSWSLVSATGEFLDGKLVSVTMRFPADNHGGLLAEVTERFGPGLEMKLEERSLLGERETVMRLWNVDGELWALEPGDRISRLVHQDRVALSHLTELSPPARRGEPVNLDDIGLGGGLDLSADDLDDIPVIEDEGQRDSGSDGGAGAIR